MSPQISALVEAGIIEARSAGQLAIFKSNQEFAKAEGILPAPEAGHAVWGAEQEALAAKEAGEARTIVFNLCGHGNFDLSAYDDYLNGRLEDYEMDDREMDAALEAVPAVD